MSDDVNVDAATALSEREREHLVDQVRQRANQQEVPRTGFCINECGAPTHGVFCSIPCRDEYNQRERFRR